MCHRTKKEQILELPPSCKAQADRMEQALREEDAASYSIASLNKSDQAALSDKEQALKQELGRELVLVAYEADSEKI